MGERHHRLPQLQCAQGQPHAEGGWDAFKARSSPTLEQSQFRSDASDSFWEAQ